MNFSKFIRESTDLDSLEVAKILRAGSKTLPDEFGVRFDSGTRYKINVMNIDRGAYSKFMQKIVKNLDIFADLKSNSTGYEVVIVAEIQLEGKAVETIQVEKFRISRR